MSEQIEALAKYMKVTPKQMEWLRAYEETLSIEEACKRSGLDKTHAMASLKKNTPFSKLYYRLAKELDRDPRFNKAGAIGMLLDLKDRAKEAGNMNLELKIIQEINKMIRGNIAAAQKEITKKDIRVRGVIDLTKPVKKQPKTVDVDYEEVSDGNGKD